MWCDVPLFRRKPNQIGLRRAGKHQGCFRRKRSDALDQTEAAIAAPFGRVRREPIRDDTHRASSCERPIVCAAQLGVTSSNRARLPYIERLALRSICGRVDQKHTAHGIT